MSISKRRIIYPIIIITLTLIIIIKIDAQLTFEINPRTGDNNNSIPSSILNSFNNNNNNNNNQQINYLDVLLADQSKRGKIYDRSITGLKDPVDILTLSESLVMLNDVKDGSSSSLHYIFVSQFMSNQVLKISPSGTSTLFAKGVYCSDKTKPCSVLDGPWGLEHFNKELFVSSFSSDQILVFNITNGEYISAFGNSIELNCPEGMTLGGDGYLYVVSYLNNEIVRYNPVTYEYVDVIIKAATISGPEDVLYIHSKNTNNNYLIVTSHWSNSILVYNATTITTPIITSINNNNSGNHTTNDSGGGGFELLYEYGQNETNRRIMQGPVGLLKYDDTNILVSLQGHSNKIIKINIINGAWSMFAEYKYMKGPSGMSWLGRQWYDNSPPKTLVVAGYNTNTLYVFNETKKSKKDGKFELVAKLV